MADTPEYRLKVVVIVPHYWGKGDTIAEAWGNVEAESSTAARRHKKDGKFAVYMVAETDDCKARCDEISGGLIVPRGAPRPVQIDGLFD
jgi:hypothetical protein